MMDFPDVWGIKRDKIRQEYRESRTESDEQLKSFIKKFLRKKGLKPDWIKASNGKVYSKDIWVEPNGIIGIDFSYIYSDHVHFMIDERRDDGSGLWTNIAIAKWYFDKKPLKSFYDKKIKIYIK